MANWAADWLERNPDLAGRTLTRHRHGITAQINARERVSHFVGSPAHWQDTNGVWQPLDTALQLIGTEYGAPGLATRIGLDGAVRIAGQSHSHRSTRVGIFTPATKSFAAHRTIPNGQVDGDRIVAENGIWSRILTITENGLREEIAIAEQPSIPGVKLSDWLVLETAVQGSSFPDGWLDEFQTSGVHFPLPHAHDANGDQADCKRYARAVGGVQYIYTGVPVSWLATAVYPVTIDPDYAADSADGWVRGYDLTYAIARSTYQYFTSNDATNLCGQSFNGTNYSCNRLFLLFDTSAISDGDIISQVNLKLVATNDSSTTDFDVQIVDQNWSSQNPLASGNADAAYDGCLAGTEDANIWRNTNSMSINTVYTSGNLNVSWVSKTANTYYSLRSSRDYAGNAPAGGSAENISIALQNHATSGYRPLLAVTHAAAAGNSWYIFAQMM